MIGATTLPYDGRVGEATAPPRVVPSSTTTLGKFTLLDKIGEGGMARIWLARAHGIGGFEKLVVVKQILPRLAEDAEFVARFFQEARLAATLQHPNIAEVYEVDEADGVYFYTMEYVRGRDLRHVLQRARQRERTLSWSEVIAVMVGLCAGLHHAHTRADERGRPLGIVHRDVSPANVLLSFDGEVKLADFGVAKARTSMVSTVAGRLRGKIPYMSPEQCRGEALDRRSDVYSAGVVLWESIAGRRLHDGDSEIAVLRAISDRDAAPIEQAREDCPPALAQIVARALARSPAQRYQSAEQLQLQLEAFAREARLDITGRTVTTLLDELFGDDPRRQDAKPVLTAVPVAGTPVSLCDQTPPTGTLPPPPAASSSAAAPRPVSGDPLEVVVPGSRRWGGLVVGVLVGSVLGMGGLYLALRGQVRLAPVAQTPAGLAPVAATAGSEPDAGSAAPESSSSSDDAAAEADAVDIPPPQPPAAGDPEATARPKKRRRKSKTGKADRRDLDLDSALPPGFSSQ